MFILLSLVREMEKRKWCAGAPRHHLTIPLHLSHTARIYHLNIYHLPFLALRKCSGALTFT